MDGKIDCILRVRSIIKVESLGNNKEVGMRWTSVMDSNCKYNTPRCVGDCFIPIVCYTTIILLYSTCSRPYLSFARNGKSIRKREKRRKNAFTPRQVRVESRGDESRWQRNAFTLQPLDACSACFPFSIVSRGSVSRTPAHLDPICPFGLDYGSGYGFRAETFN